MTLAMLGKAKMVRIEKENTTIVDGAGETTWRRAGAILDLVSPAECANYLVNPGYASV